MSRPGQAEIDALEADLAEFIGTAPPVRGPARGADFWALARRLHAHHLAHNDDWRGMFGGMPPAPRWEELPAAPVTLFRDLPLTSFDPADAAVTFRTSGTTGPRGVVRLRDTRLYDLGARRQAAAVAGPIPRVGSSLVPHDPDSSLGHMCLDLAPGLRPRFTLAGGVDIDGLRADLDEYCAGDSPVFLPGTAFAFAALIGALPAGAPPFRLPAGSVLMLTGGFKGRVVQLSAEALRDRLDALFPSCRRVEEYGMSELSSQLWAPALRAPFLPPPWLGVLTVDPWTGAPAAEGLLRFIDLASLHTAPFIETRDLGRVLADGRVELRGRLPGEHPRGCSLSVEDALGRMASASLFSAEERAVDGPAHPLAAASTEVETSVFQMDEAVLPPPFTILPARAAGLGPEAAERAFLHDPWTGDRASPEELRAQARWRLFSGRSGVHPAQRPPPPPLEGADAERVAVVLRGLARLRGRDAEALGQGLSAAGAAAALGTAISAINAEGLAAELATPGRRPARVVIVVAYGVFTSPIEWCALLLAAGCVVHLKAPARDPALCLALAEDMRAEGLPCTASPDRRLPACDKVLAFGGDAGVAAVAAGSAAPVVQHGHRMSVLLTEGDPVLAHAWAWDAAWYDTRGCLAPTALFCLGDPGPLVEALHEAMGQAAMAMPRGACDPGLGPEWRRRVGLARRLGRALVGEEHAVLQLPAAHFLPLALPRMIVVHAIEDGHALHRLLRPWAAHLSTLGTEDWLRHWRDAPQWWPVYAAFPRLAQPGALQRPPFPRRHDGLPMLGSLLDAGDIIQTPVKQ